MSWRDCKEELDRVSDRVSKKYHVCWREYVKVQHGLGRVYVGVRVVGL